MVAWQTVKEMGLNLFKKKSRSRRLWIGGSSLTVFGVLAYIFLLAGVTISTSGDVTCGDTCEIYVNITSTYWEMCFSDVSFEPIYFNESPISYEVLVPARGKDNWRALKPGDCIKRKNKYNVLPNRFKIIIEKKAWETIKYGVEFGGTDLDPFLFSENIKLVDKKKYERLCDEVFEEKYIEESYFHINGSATRQIKTNEVVDCISNGKIKVNDKEIDLPNHNCELTETGAVCDLIKENGQRGDANGDGECSRGESCVVY